eukprot:3891960-Amphidinium_carterae.1
MRKLFHGKVERLRPRQKTSWLFLPGEQDLQNTSIDSLAATSLDCRVKDTIRAKSVACHGI